LINYKNIRRK